MTLINQLVEEIQNEFDKREDSYKNTKVKEIYKPLPKLKNKYLKVVIQEISNSEIRSRSTIQGEMTTQLGYQITTYSRDTEEYDAVDSVKFMMDIVNDYLQSKYLMRRLGDRVIVPYITDNTIMTCTQRYTCVYDKETNLIYED